jgi:translation initiation factor IF-2
MQAELADVRSLEIPALEARHKEAQARTASEISRLKHALKAAEQAAAAAQQAAAAAGQEGLQQQLQDALKERERYVQQIKEIECERRGVTAGVVSACVFCMLHLLPA